MYRVVRNLNAMSKVPSIIDYLEVSMNVSGSPFKSQFNFVDCKEITNFKIKEQYLDFRCLHIHLTSLSFYKFPIINIQLEKHKLPNSHSNIDIVYAYNHLHVNNLDPKKFEKNIDTVYKEYTVTLYNPIDLELKIVLI
jgi:hypothetical protein